MTGVQTCALPIWPNTEKIVVSRKIISTPAADTDKNQTAQAPVQRVNMREEIAKIDEIFPSVTAESGIRHPSIWKRLSVQEIWGTVSQRDTEEKDTAVFYSKNY